MWLTERGPVGYCGRTDGGARTVPCPWCGAGPHLTALGDPERCPEYSLRAPDAASRPGDGTAECLGCGHDFERDSSPEPDYCWSCADWLAWLTGRGVS